MSFCPTLPHTSSSRCSQFTVAAQQHPKRLLLLLRQQQRPTGRLGQQKRAVCCAASSPSTTTTATAAVPDLDEAVLRIDAAPFIGPIQVVNIEGAGRGVVVTRDVAPGELLLCCHPLAVVTGPQQQRLTVDQLQVQLATNINPTVTSWLDQLYDGTDASTQHLPDLQAAAAVQQQQQEQAHLLASFREQQQQLLMMGTAAASNSPQQQQQQHAAHNNNGNSSSSSSSSSATSSHQQQQQQQQPLSSPVVTDALLQHIMDVVRYNAYSDLHDDLAAAAAAVAPVGEGQGGIGQQPVSLIGLYPEFSYFNHSCVPNCINWVLPGEPRAMVVRAARHIRAGHEATISYLGGPQLLPLEGRRQALGNFGFSCRCSRCTSEEEVSPDVAECMDDIVSRVYQSFSPRLAAAVSAGDMPAVDVVQRQAAAMMTQLYSLFRRHRVHPSLRQQLLASCFPALELLADAAQAEADYYAAAAAGSSSSDGNGSAAGAVDHNNGSGVSGGEGHSAERQPSSSSTSTSTTAAVKDLQDAAAEALRKCLEAAAAVTPGSDLHCILAAKLEAVATAAAAAGGGASSGSQGGDSSSSNSKSMLAAAHAACVSAHTARYGPLTEQQRQRLAEFNRTLYV